jgi:hypothetical protein
MARYLRSKKATEVFWDWRGDRKAERKDFEPSEIE